jgi:hypothetical protein
MSDTTKLKFYEFLEFAPKQGLVPNTTIRVWKAGAAAALEEIGDNENVLTVDLGTELYKYNNRNPGKVSPDTLRRYKSWASAGISTFERYAEDPMNFKVGTSAKKTSEVRNQKKPKTTTPTNNNASNLLAKSNSNPVTELQALPSTTKSAGIPIAYPLRPDFRVQVVLPEDMTTIEAKRIARFIMSYAQDLPTD